ncbi:MAG: DUF4236 domain-containing protein [Bacteroidales bacterium]|nr:DUF4236 domain-containing protein [Bacteroidales bacterium]
MSGSGPSFTVGRKGFGLTFGPRGAYMHTGIPGTGIYSRKKISTNEFVYNSTNFEEYEFDFLGWDGARLVLGLFLAFSSFFIGMVAINWIGIAIGLSFIFLSIISLRSPFRKLFGAVSDIEKAAFILVRRRKIDSNGIQRIKEKLSISEEQARSLVEDLTILGVISQPDLTQAGTLTLHTNGEVRRFFKRIKKDPNKEQKYAELKRQREHLLLKTVALILSRSNPTEPQTHLIEKQLSISKEQAIALTNKLTSMGLYTRDYEKHCLRFLLHSDEEVENYFEHLKEDDTYPQKWTEQRKLELIAEAKVKKEKAITEAKAQLERTTNECRKKFIEGFIAESEGREDSQINVYNYTAPQHIIYAGLTVASKLINISEKMWRNDNGQRTECRFEFSKFNGVDPQAITINYGRYQYYIYPHIIVKAKSSMEFSILPIQECAMHFGTISETIRHAPSDAKVLGYTYEKVNKDGSKDLRYKDNCKLTIVEYGIIEITRLNIKIFVSNRDGAASFVSAYNNMFAAMKDCPIEIDDKPIIDDEATIAYGNMHEYDPEDVLGSRGTDNNVDTFDPLFCQVAEMIVNGGDFASTSNIQRQFELGYNRAYSIMDQMERVGIVGPQIKAGKPRLVRVHTLAELNDIIKWYNIPKL